MILSELNCFPSLVTQYLNSVQVIVGAVGITTWSQKLTTWVSYTFLPTLNLTVIADLSVKYHDWYWLSILTLDISSHALVPFHHTKLSTRIENHEYDVTLFVTNHVLAYIVFPLKSENIRLIYFKFLVSRLLKSKLLKLLHPSNILLILVTLLVSQLLTSKFVNLLHWENI